MSKIMFVSSLDHMSGGDAWHCLLHISGVYQVCSQAPLIRKMVFWLRERGQLGKSLGPTLKCVFRHRTSATASELGAL